MRRITLFGVLAMTALALAAPASAARTVSFHADFQEFFGIAPAHPCVEFYTCGTGSVAGFGAASSGTELVDFGGVEPGTSCSSVVYRRTITLVDGSGTLVLIESGTACFPGGSFAKSAKAAGNPVSLETQWTVESETGVFADATGTGVESFKNAGNAGHSSLSGTLTLP